MINIGNEAETIKCALCNEFNHRFDVLAKHIMMASGSNEVAEDIQCAWLNLMAALDACKRVF